MFLNKASGSWLKQDLTRSLPEKSTLVFVSEETDVSVLYAVSTYCIAQLIHSVICLPPVAVDKW